MLLTAVGVQFVLFAYWWHAFYYVNFSAVTYGIGYGLLEVFLTRSSEMRLIDLSALALLLIVLVREKRRTAGGSQGQPMKQGT